MNWKLHVTVAAIVEEAGRFLMVEERCGGRLVFNQPAGHLDQGETLQDAVVRETLEETGWHIHPEHFILVQQWNRPGRADTYVRFVFSGNALTHDPDRALDSVIHQVHWMRREDLVAKAGRMRSPMVLEAIDAYLDGRRHDLNVLQAI
ncbi:MAG: NUDIX domain-containing protein [Gammaproteobacteria bacterium]|nr:NUDIX domain-containing protein [Gammaproteobacteria bacterium]